MYSSKKIGIPTSQGGGSTLSQNALSYLSSLKASSEALRKETNVNQRSLGRNRGKEKEKSPSPPSLLEMTTQKNVTRRGSLSHMIETLRGRVKSEDHSDDGSILNPSLGHKSADKDDESVSSFSMDENVILEMSMSDDSQDTVLNSSLKSNKSTVLPTPFKEQGKSLHDLRELRNSIDQTLFHLDSKKGKTEENVERTVQPIPRETIENKSQTKMASKSPFKNFVESGSSDAESIDFEEEIVEKKEKKKNVKFEENPSSASSSISSFRVSDANSARSGSSSISESSSSSTSSSSSHSSSSSPVTSLHNVESSSASESSSESSDTSRVSYVSSVHSIPQIHSTQSDVSKNLEERQSEEIIDEEDSNFISDDTKKNEKVEERSETPIPFSPVKEMEMSSLSELESIRSSVQQQGFEVNLERYVSPKRYESTEESGVRNGNEVGEKELIDLVSSEAPTKNSPVHPIKTRRRSLYSDGEISRRTTPKKNEQEKESKKKEEKRKMSEEMQKRGENKRKSRSEKLKEQKNEKSQRDEGKNDREKEMKTKKKEEKRRASSLRRHPFRSGRHRSESSESSDERAHVQQGMRQRHRETEREKYDYVRRPIQYEADNRNSADSSYFSEVDRREERRPRIHENYRNPRTRSVSSFHCSCCSFNVSGVQQFHIDCNTNVHGLVRDVINSHLYLLREYTRNEWETLNRWDNTLKQALKTLDKETGKSLEDIVDQRSRGQFRHRE